MVSWDGEKQASVRMQSIITNNLVSGDDENQTSVNARFHWDSEATQCRLTSVTTHDMLWVGLIFCYSSVLGSRFCDSVSPTHSRLSVGNEQSRLAVLHFFKQVWLTSTREHLELIEKWPIKFLLATELQTHRHTPPERYSGNTH